MRIPQQSHRSGYFECGFISQKWKKVPKICVQCAKKKKKSNKMAKKKTILNCARSCTSTDTERLRIKRNFLSNNWHTQIRKKRTIFLSQWVSRIATFPLTRSQEETSPNHKELTKRFCGKVPNFCFSRNADQTKFCWPLRRKLLIFIYLFFFLFAFFGLAAYCRRWCRLVWKDPRPNPIPVAGSE